MPASEVMGKFKRGQLHSGSKSGPQVKSRAQAIAIMLSEKRAESAHGGKYPERADGGAALDGGYQIGGMPMGMGLGMQPPPPPMGPMGAGMMPQGLGRGYQFGGMPNYSNIFERSEARQMMHTGPILSTVGGRTDQHAISVPSGSYVFPAAHVSALGQGNTINGLKVLSGMFGPSIHNPRGGGMGIPHARPPAPMKMNLAGPKLPATMTSTGGSRGAGHVGKPVDIMAAGGEYVIGPDQVMRVGGGDLNRGHKILDHWVQKTHKKFAKTVANLPPPAKS